MTEIEVQTCAVISGVWAQAHGSERWRLPAGVVFWPSVRLLVVGCADARYARSWRIPERLVQS